MCAAMAMTDEARKKANLRLLQRSVDSSITDILASATHVVLYEFAQASWSKSEVDGSLFVVATKRKEMSAVGATAAPYFLTILNRSSTDNFIMPITIDLHLQHQPPYLICKQIVHQNGSGNNQSKIQGIWFHHDKERVTVTQTLEQLIQSVKSPPPAHQIPNPPIGSVMGPSTTPCDQHQQLLHQSAPISSSGISIGRSTGASSISASLTTDHNPVMAATPPHLQPHSSSSNSVLLSSLFPSASSNLTAVSNNHTAVATPDERAQLAALLSQTASMAVSQQSPAPPQPTPSQQTNATDHNITTSARSTSTIPPLPSQSIETPAPPGGRADGDSNPTSVGMADSTVPAVTLDKRSLQLTLLSLIQDDRFLDLLHSQYMRVMKARAKKGPGGGNGSTSG